MRIATARRATELILAELAAMLDWPHDALIHYEYGRRAIAVDRIECIASVLAVPPTTFLMEDEALAHVVSLIANDPYLPKQILFFLHTLAESEEASDTSRWCL